MPGKQTSTREIREKAFIEKSVEKYGEHYDYSLVEYEKNNVLVTILDIEVPAIVGIERERRALEQFSDSRYYLPRGESFKGCTELFRTDVKSDLIRLLESNE